MPVKRRRLSFSVPRLAPLVLGIVVGLGLSATARAQSLYELYEAARGFDAPYLAARSAADSAVYRVEQVHARRRPQLALGLSAGRGTSDSDSGDVTSRSTAADLSGTQSLFNRPLDIAINQADKSLEVAKADVVAAEQDLIVRVAQAYFDVLAAQDTLETAQANQRAISEQLASAKRNFEVGTATITDTREAQARSDLATAQELQADNDLRAKRIALDTLVGRSGVSPKPLAVPANFAPLVPGTVEEWVAPTDTAPPVRRARVQYEVAQLETERARAARLPTVGLSGSVGRGHTSVSPASPFTTSGSDTTTRIGVSLNLPLFTGFETQNRIKETLQLEDQARNLLEAARRTQAQQARVAYFGVESLQAQVTALEAAEASSLLALEATQLGYKVGVRVNLDVLNAQTQLFNARRDLARARYDVLVNSLRLRQAAGTLMPDDVLQVNQLLAK
ncbi:TolC family outer membrane protein [Piscinibacter sp.]|uniref:TolC family outer membrane protein n=1 Tax=Piscinibacter sp. TaxID=1903157 RepID=UPI002C42880E|nr:TolC family outer membrane protein [Albitalea sp.]HUG21969.1 TolC family outer membrane protein [Albitalea sp.]